MDNTISERMMKEPVNKIAISLIVSKDITKENGEIIPAVRKISDRLTSVKTFLSGGRNADGSWGDSASLDVNITSSTIINDGVQIKPGEHLTFVGFLAARSYVNADNNKKRAYLVLVAQEVMKTPTREKPETEDSQSNETSSAQKSRDEDKSSLSEMVNKDMLDDLPWG